VNKIVILVVVVWVLLFSKSTSPVPASPSTKPAPIVVDQVKVTVAPEPGVTEVPAAPLEEVPEVVGWMLERNNEHRASVGLSPMELDARLCKAAQDHATYLATTGTFDHYVNGNPRTRAAKYGFPVRDLTSLEVRENIAGDFQSVTNAFLGWKGSPGHWENILSDCNLCGFGYASGRYGRRYVAVYGRAETSQGVRISASVPPEVVCKDGVCTLQQAPVAQQVATGKWVLENVPIYGRFGAIRGYSQKWRWQGPARATAVYYGSCSSCR
jgi:uncharacterized protein YkwD